MKVEKAIPLATKWKEDEPVASNIGHTFIYCVDFIFTAADDENSQTYPSMLMVSIVTTEDFIQKYWINLIETLNFVSWKNFEVVTILTTSLGNQTPLHVTLCIEFRIDST